MSVVKLDANGVVADAWAKVLKIEQVDPDSDFFAVGGDSVAAARVCAAIQARTGKVLTLGQFVDSPTPRALAALLESLPVRRAEPVEGTQAGRGALPVLPSQEIYLRRDEWSKTSGIYDNGHAIVETVRLRGPLDAAAFSIAVSAVGRHHAALRGRFGAGAGEHEYVISISDEDVRLIVHEVDDIEQVHEAYDQAHRARRDRLSGAALCGFDLYWLAPDDHVLILWVDHMVSDSWSFAVLLDDLAESYNEVSRGRLPRLRGELGYERFHADRLAWPASDEAAAARAFWGDVLEGFGPDPDIDFLGAPRGEGPPAEQQDEILIPVPAAAYASSTVLPGATRFAAFCAATALTLGRHSGRDRIGVITGVALRRDPALERLVGWVSNSIVIPVALDPRSTLRELAGWIGAFVLSAQDHGAYGRNSLIQELDPVKFGEVRRHAGAFVAVEPADPDDEEPFDGLRWEALPWTRGFSRHGVTCLLKSPSEATASIALESGWLGPRRRRQFGDDLALALRLLAQEPETTVEQAQNAMSGPRDWQAEQA